MSDDDIPQFSLDDDNMLALAEEEMEAYKTWSAQVDKLPEADVEIFKRLGQAYMTLSTLVKRHPSHFPQDVKNHLLAINKALYHVNMRQVRRWDRVLYEATMYADKEATRHQS